MTLNGSADEDLAIGSRISRAQAFGAKVFHARVVSRATDGRDCREPHEQATLRCLFKKPMDESHSLDFVETSKDCKMERTYIMIKPDGVQRGLVGEIIKRFEQKGFKLVAMKLTKPSKEHMETHYEDLKTKKFFPGLIEYMTSGPVVAMVWEGK